MKGSTIGGSTTKSQLKMREYEVDLNLEELEKRYTHSSSRVENLTRSCPEFEPGEAGVEAAQLEQVERYRQASNSVADDAVKNRLLNLNGYK